MPFYTKGDVTIHYNEVGSGFPLLATPGGGLNSKMDNWPGQVFDSMEVFKNDFRVITMDQRNPSAASRPVRPGRRPWGAFADMTTGLMDHLAQEFLFIRLLHRRNHFHSHRFPEPRLLSA